MAIKMKNLIRSSSSEDLKIVLQTLGSDWGDVVEDLECVEVVPLKGAMTNEVYQMNWPTKNGEVDRKVLVRIYGEGVDVFFNREDEIRTFECMSRHGQGPRLLGRFADGRLEEFIHARTLSAEDLRSPEISALIAAKLREFHNLSMPGPRNVLLWDRMRKWLKEAKRLCSVEEAEEFELDALEDEIERLELKLKREDQEIGFCHNDMQYGNIMMEEETKAITIIDYEYASYNPVAYDVANHFCEMAANYHSETPHVLDYSLYPGVEERTRFIREYLGGPSGEQQVERLLNDAEKYTLANHIYWALWGIISGHVNKIEFDYKEYARQRLWQYWLSKPLLLPTI